MSNNNQPSGGENLTSRRCTTAEDLTPVYWSNFRDGGMSSEFTTLPPLLLIGSTPDRLKFAYSVWALGFICSQTLVREI